MDGRTLRDFRPTLPTVIACIMIHYHQGSYLMGLLDIAGLFHAFRAQQTCAVYDRSSESLGRSQRGC